VQVLTGATDPNFLPILAKAKTLGVQWVRVYLYWSSIQPVAPASPGCGNCDWSYPDTLLSALAAQGLTPIVLITGNPRWAATYALGPIDPAYLPDFGKFVSALVQRYPNVQYWEFYNEPDEWTQVANRGWGAHGDQYAAMLKTAYAAIHSPGSAGNQKVVFGGVAYEPSQACRGRPKNQCFDNGFISQVLKYAKGSPLFDIMAFHYYDAFAKNYSPANVLGKALKLKQTYAFLKNKPFLVTELGKSYQFGTNPNFSHELAARQVVEMFSHILAAPGYKVNILAGTWYTLEHFEEPTGSAPGLRGLLDESGGLGAAASPPRKWGLLDQNDYPWPQEGGAYTTTVNELSSASYLNRITPGGVTGYNFKLADGTNHAVLWATNPSATVLPKLSFRVTTTSLRWLDKQGNATTVTDNGPGDLDKHKGLIGLRIPTSPIFVEYK
jgi:hypothetical protein